MKHASHITRTQALDFYGLTEDFEEDELLDAFAEEVFAVKNYVLRNTPLPSLFRSRQKRLNQADLHLEVLLANKKEEFEIEKVNVSDSDHIVPFLRSYSSQQMRLKTQMAKASQPNALIQIMEQMLVLQHLYNVKWHAFFENLPDNPNLEVKVGSQTDTGMLIHALERSFPNSAAAFNFEKIHENPQQEEDLTLIQAETQRIRKLLGMSSYEGIENS